jgi:hypothetical protein
MDNFLHTIDKTRKIAINNYINRVKELLSLEIQKDPSLLEISIDADIPSVETAMIVCNVLNKEGIITRVHSSFGLKAGTYIYYPSYIHYLCCTVRGIDYNRHLNRNINYENNSDSDSD